MSREFESFIAENLAGCQSPFQLGYIDSQTLWVARWNWDYLSALDFQKKAIAFVKDNPLLKIYIFCNHPHCFTMGRGLQKKGGSTVEGLLEFDFASTRRLPFTCHKINRGGGLTFHYPGQWIFYPIVNLSNPKHRLKEITYWLLESSKAVLEKALQLGDLDTQKQFLGLWHCTNKIASVGIGVEKFVTHHGLALNLLWDEEMFSKLHKVNPCGISPAIYSSVDRIIRKNSNNLIQQFHQRFIEHLKPSASIEDTYKFLVP